MSQVQITINDSKLTEREMEILDFENSWFTLGAPKEQMILARFNLSTARYYQVLNQLIDRAESLQYAPLLIKRLRRLRTKRQQARSAKRLNNIG